jgi:hypothetical protein
MSNHQVIRIRRGNHANLPTSGLALAEPLFSIDRHTLHIAEDATTPVPVVPAIDELSTLSGVNGADDFLIMHDASASGVKEKKITFNAFKSALNIPEGSTDELVAASDGGEAGYLWENGGDEGVLRIGDGLDYALDLTNGDFVTISLDLNLSATFTGNGGSTELNIASGVITYAMLHTDLQADIDGKLEEVATDSSLGGDGTTGDPLFVAIVDGGEF